MIAIKFKAISAAYDELKDDGTRRALRAEILGDYGNEAWKRKGAGVRAGVGAGMVHAHLRQGVYTSGRLSDGGVLEPAVEDERR